MIVHFFKMILEETGYQVDAAFTGLDAIECARNHSIDLAILDYKLSDMTGDILARELREIKSDIIIMFITGYSEVKDRILRTNLASHVVVKPIKDDELLDLVDEAFQGKSMVLKR